MPKGGVMGAGLYLGLVQWVFALTWTLYVAFLPQLAAGAGIERKWVIWLLLFDQLLFTLMDLALGLAADRVAAGMRRLSGPIVMVTAVSCPGLPAAAPCRLAGAAHRPGGAVGGDFIGAAGATDGADRQVRAAARRPAPGAAVHARPGGGGGLLADADQRAARARPAPAVRARQRRLAGGGGRTALVRAKSAGGCCARGGGSRRIRPRRRSGAAGWWCWWSCWRWARRCIPR